MRGAAAVEDDGFCVPLHTPHPSILPPTDDLCMKTLCRFAAALSLSLSLSFGARVRACVFVRACARVLPPSGLSAFPSDQLMKRLAARRYAGLLILSPAAAAADPGPQPADGGQVNILLRVFPGQTDRETDSQSDSRQRTRQARRVAREERGRDGYKGRKKNWPRARGCV